MDKRIYENCLNALKEELLPAMGCTEPIAVAYAAALARDTLGMLPTTVEIAVSGNILKNVKSVVVPNTGGLRGVVSATAAGIALGVAENKLEVLANVNDSCKDKILNYLNATQFTVSQSTSECIFDISIKAINGENYSLVRITGHHTNIVRIEKNGKIILNKVEDEKTENESVTENIFSVSDIIDFADCVKIEDIKSVIERQIEYNWAIAQEGLKNDYGANVGKILLKSFGDNVHNRAKAMAAAGSDARMNGCSMPVVIVSGSGNQGMTASLPVIVYAKHLNASNEQLLRALVVSDLITIHLKKGIGRLSAYCGAVSAGAGAGAGICYLYGGKKKEVSHTIVNALAIDSGIICDGAKSSCAAKIASAVEAGLLGMEMYKNGSQFYGGDGIVVKGVENTINNVGDLARNGMRQTDEEIIRLMIKSLN
ncbi:MAG: serine dehydratase subunit alpha family protein [Clostridiales bacterium]|nr:serine dehydratase subunit alpha family protein [Clostridiales bacterium]